MGSSEATVPWREAKGSSGLQCCLLKIFRRGRDLAPLLPFRIQIRVIQIINKYFFPKKIEGLSRGPTSVLRPYSPSPESPGGPCGDGCRQAGVSSQLCLAVLLGVGAASSLPSACPGSPGPQHLHSPSQPRTGRSLWVRACHPSLPLGTQEVRASGPVALCLPLEHGLAGQSIWGSHGATRGTSKGEDGE